MRIDTWLAPAPVFLAVTRGAVCPAVLREWAGQLRRQRRGKGQLERLSVEGLESVAPGAGSLFRGGPGAHSDEKLSARLPQLKDLQHRLEQAALGWSVK